jgi:hypothetical protein
MKAHLMLKPRVVERPISEADLKRQAIDLKRQAKKERQAARTSKFAGR